MSPFRATRTTTTPTGGNAPRVRGRMGHRRRLRYSARVWPEQPRPVLSLIGRADFVTRTSARPLKLGLHAVAIDERRRPFVPTFWTLRPKPRRRSPPAAQNTGRAGVVSRCAFQRRGRIRGPRLVGPCTGLDDGGGAGAHQRSGSTKSEAMSRSGPARRPRSTIPARATGSTRSESVLPPPPKPDRFWCPHHADAWFPAAAFPARQRETALERTREVRMAVDPR